MRVKTHWCNDGKHDKCGGKVQEIKNNDAFDLADENYAKKACHCFCHN